MRGSITGSIVSRLRLVDERMEKSDFDPKRIPPQPSLRKVIKLVIFAHLAIAAWVIGIILTDGEMIVR